jgi:FdhD protein
MADGGRRSEAVESVRAARISTQDAAARPEPEDVVVAVEAPLLIDVAGVDTYAILCTPTDRRALVVGFLLSEGIVDHADEIEVLKPCDDDPDTFRVRLAGQIPRVDDAGRNLLIVSSCGACGSESLRERIRALPRVADTLRIESSLLRSVYDALRERQVLFTASGGTHAAALFDSRGAILGAAEDTGRHNALDKAIGKCALAGLETAGRAVALTSRLSLEMVGKCARAGIEVIAAVSAPTTLAIDVAERCDVTLCAYVRETRATVFTHARRIVLS